MLRMSLAVAAVAAATVLQTAAPAMAAPGGTYQATCGRIDQRGPILSAVCRTRDGDRRRSSINFRACGGDIANLDGQLSCVGRGRGGYGGGGYGYGGDRERYRRY